MKNAAGVVLATDTYDIVVEKIKAYVTADAEAAYCGDPIGYTVSIDNVAAGVGTVSLNFTVDTANQKLDLATAVTPLSGFTTLSLKWTDLGGGVWKGAVTLMYPGFITSEAPIDIVKIATKAGDKAGVATVEISGLSVTGNVGGNSGYLGSEIIVGQAETEVVVKQPIYSKYDLNHDGKINVLDTNIAVFFYLKSSASPGWDTELFDRATAKEADVNGSGRVDLADLIEILANYCDSYDLFPY